MMCRVATADTWQARPPQCSPHPCCTAAAATALYLETSRQDLGLASRGDPDVNKTYQRTIVINLLIVYKNI